MKEMAVGELKTHFSEVLEEVKQGEKIKIMYGRAKKPLAMIVPFEEEKKRQTENRHSGRKSNSKIQG